MPRSFLVNPLRDRLTRICERLLIATANDANNFTRTNPVGVTEKNLASHWAATLKQLFALAESGFPHEKMMSLEQKAFFVDVR